MPRPKKFRRICCLPSSHSFGPLGLCSGEQEQVTLAVDEFETLRLIDLENLTHEECAKRMNVSRTTVTGIYNLARKKLTDSLVNGKLLVVGGGDYVVCDSPGHCCRDAGCRLNLETANNMAPDKEI